MYLTEIAMGGKRHQTNGMKYKDALQLLKSHKRPLVSIPPQALYLYHYPCPVNHTLATAQCNPSQCLQYCVCATMPSMLLANTKT